MTADKESLNILKDKNLFKNIVETELNKKIVGEIESRKVIVLCSQGGRLVENAQIASFNLMIIDGAGVGKDYTANESLKPLPSQYLLKRTRISATVLNYWHNAKDDPQWTWDGKVLYLEDISENILNHEVFKVMCSGGSSATIVKDQKIIELEIKGKPVMIITTATATPNPELTRRFVMLNLDSSKDQTKEIMKRHSQFRQEGIIPTIDPKYKNALQWLKRVKVKIPFADLIHEHFPIDNVIMRTHYPRFLDFISASTAFHQFQRKEEKGFVIAEGQDYDLARDCFLKLCSNKYMIPLTLNQKKILEIFESKPFLEGSIAELHASEMNFISDRALSYNLSLLGSYGILESKAKINQFNKTVESYSLSKNYNINQKIDIPTFKKIGGSEGSEARSGGVKLQQKQTFTHKTTKKTPKPTSLPILEKDGKRVCQSASLPSQPSLPSPASLPSQPTTNTTNNKNNNKEFSSKDFLKNEKELREIIKEFEQ